MLSFREHYVLKEIYKAIEEHKKNKSYKSDMIFLDDNFFQKLKYEKYTTEYLLSKLHKKEYIIDTTNCIETKVHSVTITNKGKDAANNYLKLTYIYLFFELIRFIFYGFIGLLIENFFNVFDFLKKYIG